MDCDAFYASVEKRDRPELRDLPVIVGGGTRGVVTTCCYIARMSGVRSAMPMFQARRLCPDAVVIKPDFAKYVAESRRIRRRLEALTPLVQPLSLDEAWLDLRGVERLHGAAPAVILARLQRDIERDIGLTVSVGLSANKFLAKIASDLDKPRGFAVIGGAEAAAFLAPRPVGLLPGVGPALARRLASDGFLRIGDLTAGAKRLEARYGPTAQRLLRLAQGIDGRAVDPDGLRKSLSAETTFEHDLSGLSDLEDVLWRLCEKVGARARAESITGRVVGLKLRTSQFRTLSRQMRLPGACQTSRTLFAAARQLLAAQTGQRSFRLIGVGLSDLAPANESQAELFADAESRALMAERAVDVLRERFGPDAVVSARALRF